MLVQNIKGGLASDLDRINVLPGFLHHRILGCIARHDQRERNHQHDLLTQHPHLPSTTTGAGELRSDISEPERDTTATATPPPTDQP
jgi:hypothetical protein